MKNTSAPINPASRSAVIGRSRATSSHGIVAFKPRALCVVVSVLCLTLGVPACEKEVTLDDIRTLQQSAQIISTVKPLRKMVDEGTDDPEVFYLYGRALSTLGERDAALWPLRRAMEHEDWRVRAGMQLAQDAFDGASPDTAIATLDLVLEASPDDVPALVLRSRSRVDSRRDLPLALADADRALEIDPDAHLARIARILALLAMEMVEEAAVALEAIEEFSFEDEASRADSARFCGARASFAKEKGERELADERYTKCLELFPGSPVLVADALKFYESQQDSERVIEILKAALEDSPDSRDFRVGLATRLGARQRHDEALEILRELTDSANPQVAANAWMDVAGFLISRDDMVGGIEAFEKVLEATPDPSPELLFRYADLLVVAERYDDAVEVADKMSLPAHQHLVRGRVHFERDEFAPALKELSAGLKNWPENAVARYYAALAAEELGMFDRAVEEYRYSIRSSAKDTDARLRLAQLHAAEGNFPNAVTILRHDLASKTTDVEMALLELEIIWAASATPGVPAHVGEVIHRPGVWQRATIVMARGTNSRLGPAEAAKFIAGTGADLADPTAAIVLRDMVRYLAEDGRAAEGLALAEASLAEYPQEAALHAVVGFALLLDDPVANGDDAGEPSDAEERAEDARGGDEERETVRDLARAQVELETALELDPSQRMALAGLGQLAAISGDSAKAADYLLRADEADPTESAALEAAIDVLIASKRVEEAERQLERLLDREPYEGGASLRLVELRVARGAGQEARTRVLARHAMRFGGQGAAAVEVLKTASTR